MIRRSKSPMRRPIMERSKSPMRRPIPQIPIIPRDFSDSDAFSNANAKLDNSNLVEGEVKSRKVYSTIVPLKDQKQIPNKKKPLVVALFRTEDNKSYMMRFRNQVNEVVPALQKYIGKNIPVEVQS